MAHYTYWAIYGLFFLSRLPTFRQISEDNIFIINMSNRHTYFHITKPCVIFTKKRFKMRVLIFGHEKLFYNKMYQSLSISNRKKKLNNSFFLTCITFSKSFLEISNRVSKLQKHNYLSIKTVIFGRFLPSLLFTVTSQDRDCYPL